MIGTDSRETETREKRGDREVVGEIVRQIEKLVDSESTVNQIRALERCLSLTRDPHVCRFGRHAFDRVT